MTVRVILDTTALLSYARMEGQEVGELVGSAMEDPDVHVGIPAACYLAAYADLDPDERARLHRFATDVDGMTVILPLDGSVTPAVAEMTVQVPKLAGIWHAIAEAQARRAVLATFAGDFARQHLPALGVLDLN